jgi:phosphopantothenoylcysteine decarboxylase/phosphopantothenate--cysteine ligase
MIIPENLLENRNILVGVTGSIAIYKSLEYIRLLVKAGANVRVVMSESAKKFITPLTFETISTHAVLHIETENWHSDLNHISIGKWAELFVIAPATASTLNKLSHGIADNLLTQTALAFAGKKLLAPSANTNMIHNPMTQHGLKLLEEANYAIVDTQNKLLACHTKGDGAMAEPLELFYQSTKALLRDPFWEDRHIVLSGGGTIEKIDDVRFISNFSSGKMASALATALYFRGANPSLVATKFPDTLPSAIDQVHVQSGEEMLAALRHSLEDAKQKNNKEPYLFMAAAVSDYKPTAVQQAKLKKENIGDQWDLSLGLATDILKTISKDGIKAIGFKAEMDREKAYHHASSMLTKKRLDAVCLNILHDSQSFGTDTNTIEMITANGSKQFATSTKLEQSLDILEEAKTL